ncbi:MAG: DUF1587 domain-containing protein [Pedosphaera sp.]|nr:DUF1587 domain-containing protein [Pedosphaera sp.]
MTTRDWEKLHAEHAGAGLPPARVSASVRAGGARRGVAGRGGCAAAASDFNKAVAPFLKEHLLGVTFDAADPTGLSEDDVWNGFGLIGSVLSVSPSHVEKYLAAADMVLAEAFPEVVLGRQKKVVPVKPLDRRLAGADLRGGLKKAELETLGLADKVRVEMWPGTTSRAPVRATFPSRAFTRCACS